MMIAMMLMTGICRSQCKGEAATGRGRERAKQVESEGQRTDSFEW